MFHHSLPLFFNSQTNELSLAKEQKSSPSTRKASEPPKPPSEAPKAGPAKVVAPKEDKKEEKPLIKPNTPSTPKFDLAKEWEGFKASFKDDVILVNERFEAKIENSSAPPELYTDVYSPAGTALVQRMEVQVKDIKSRNMSSLQSAEAIIGRYMFFMFRMLRFSFAENTCRC